MTPVVVSPHPLATQAALELLRRGASASEATVALAAVLSVVWPNFTGLGGDAFFLLFNGGELKALNASGFSGAQLEMRGEAIPERGPGSILTVPGAVAGWQSLLDGSPLTEDLLGPAIRLAEEGAPIDHVLRRALQPETEPAWRAVMANRNDSVFRQPLLARTLWMMAGGHDFYCSEISLALCETLAEWGVPITVEDFHFQHATWEKPRAQEFCGDMIWLPTPATGGCALTRLLEIAPATDDRERWLAEAPTVLFELRRAEDQGAVAFSVVDENGRGISAIQSLHGLWGSGMWCPRTGVLLHNRGPAFSLDRLQANALGPRRRPAHTLCPVLATREQQLAILAGGSAPQFTAQVLTTLLAAGKSPRAAVDAFRWTWRQSPEAALLFENEASAHDLFGHCNLIDLRGSEPSAIADWRTG